MLNQDMDPDPSTAGFRSGWGPGLEEPGALYLQCDTVRHSNNKNVIKMVIERQQAV